MAKIEEAADTLLQRALAQAERYPDGTPKVFTQDELLEIGEVETKEDLIKLCQQLLDRSYARLHEIEKQAAFSFRTRVIGNKLQPLSHDDIMTYEHVENAGTMGIWSKALKQRMQMAQPTVAKSTKSLEGKGLIKQVKSVKNPTQKVYMLSHLSPSEGVTGGPWHSEGELDMELVGVTADAVCNFIERKSWIKGSVKREREQPVRERDVSPIAPLDDRDSPVAGKKRKRDGTEGEGGRDKGKEKKYYWETTQISHVSGWQHYPTVAAILHFIKETGFIKSEVNLTEADIQSLVDVLVFDDRIERIGGGYRTIRGVSGASEAMKNMSAGKMVGDLGEEDAGNGLTQAPCGRCPVFDLCEEGGPVNAKNCIYFDAWLKT